MAKPSDNQTAAVAALKATLEASNPPGSYATIGSWKRTAKDTGAKITVKSLITAALVEEITVVISNKPTPVYRPKV
jgi:hypothetical protein